MQRFYSTSLADGQTVTVMAKEESHHIRKVLRLRTGDQIELFDGRGGVAACRIIALKPDVTVQVLDYIQHLKPNAALLHVAQGMMKNRKMDLVVQKCTELGVATLTPLLTSRCQAGNAAGQWEKKVQRWQRIIESSCGQCRRNHFMELEQQRSFASFVGESKPAVKLLFWEEEKNCHLEDLPELANEQRIVLVLGPEGGITREEAQIAQGHGYQSVSLGRRILRAETATIATIAILQYLSGNMR